MGSPADHHIKQFHSLPFSTMMIVPPGFLCCDAQKNLVGCECRPNGPLIDW
jgi:hypothetical protein